MAIVPRGAWRRFHATRDYTALSVTAAGARIGRDVDDPRQVERQPA
jgi:hypothetical protein